MTETRHPDGSDLDSRHRFGARACHAGDSPTAPCTADIRALARSLRSGLQARMYQAWICYRKASARGSSEIAARSPGMVVVGAVVAPTRARVFPVIHPQRRRSGMALVYPTEPSLARELKRGNAAIPKRSGTSAVPKRPGTSAVPGVTAGDYGKTISTRRFCGSRTPGAVGTRGSFMPRPVMAMSLRGTPSFSSAAATALARRSESRWL